MLHEFTHADFQPHIGTKFGFGPGNALGGDVPEAPEVPLELIEVKELKAHPNALGELPNRAPFSLLFLGPPAPALEQGTYTVLHETLGELPLFIVPVGTEERGLLYEALFN